VGQATLLAHLGQPMAETAARSSRLPAATASSPPARSTLFGPNVTPAHVAAHPLVTFLLRSVFQVPGTEFLEVGDRRVGDAVDERPAEAWTSLC